MNFAGGERKARAGEAQRGLHLAGRRCACDDNDDDDDVNDDTDDDDK